MAKDKFDELDDSFKTDINDSAARARNRTVMLTPEITGQVRARLSRENEADEKSLSDFAQSDSEIEHIPTRRPISYEGFDQERDGSDVHNYRNDKTSEKSEIAGASTRNGFNPILREIHQIPVATSAGKKFSGNQNDDYVAASQTSFNEETNNVESSPPYLKSSVERPEFEEANDTVPPLEDYILWSKITPVVGFLVSFDSDPNGQVFEIRSGRAIISSEIPNGGNYLLLNDESVSPMHAIIRVTEDYQFQVLDNLSEFGTTVVRPETGEELNLSGDKALVRHGDLIRFGKRSFSVCLIGS